MAEISFNCPGCKQPIEAPEEMAGQVAACPTCDAQMTIPAAAKPQTLVIDESGVVDADTGPGPAPSSGPDSGAGGQKCPECGTVMDDDAVMCMGCGFNIKLGKKMTTDLS